MASEEGDDSFQSVLNDASKKKAKDELNERNDEDRKLAVQTLRQWVLQQDWLKSPTDFGFLLRFLRVRKFSQLAARETLENYWTIKMKRPDWHKDIDPCEPDMQEILRARTFYSPQKYDKDGCRWLFSPFGAMKTDFMEKHGIAKIYRAMILLVEWMCSDENVQVNGLKWFVDYTGKSSPARMKVFYLFNEPSFFELIYAAFSMFSSQKILDRIQMVGKNMSKMYEIADKSVLPDEYLPDDYTGPSAGSESQIIDEMMADMESPKFRNYIRNLTSSRYGVDLEKRTQSDRDTVGSFRKLNID